MVIVGVLSDTHIPGKSKELPAVLINGLTDADLIIHAGDIGRDYVIFELEEIAPVEAVAGNTDDEYIRGRYGLKKVIHVAGCKIGIIHGDGVGSTTLERARRAFGGDAVDCIVFGHSHIPFNEKIDGVLCFNPGSPTDKRRQKQFSYGLLKVEGNEVTGEIIYFE